MEVEVKQRFGNQPNMLRQFEACRKKFTELFPTQPTHANEVNKLNSPGLYEQFERIVTEEPRPRSHYVNSDIITRGYFGLLNIVV